MNAIFEDSYRLRASDFDCRSRLRPASVMDLFQDVAGRHANALGVGMNALLEKNLVWVIVRLRCRIPGEAKMYDAVRVRTWPLPADRIGYTREYRITAEDGALIAEGSSEWVLMDFVRRRIVPGAIDYPLSQFCPERSFDERFPRVRPFEDGSETYSLLPPWSDFDVNGHVNNTKYANYVLDAVMPCEDRPIKYFQMEYHREVLPGEKLDILLRREADAVIACGKSGDGERMFSCRFEFENDR